MLNKELQINISNYSILLSEDISIPSHQMKNNRAKIAEFILENLGAANVYFSKNPVLSCFATGNDPY